MKKVAVFAGIGAMSLVLPAVAGQAPHEETVSVWQIDYSGRPPFKRTLVELPAADVASMELLNQKLETERVWTTDFSGRPPFRRGYADLPVIDAASMETDVANTASSSATARPFFKKRHR